MQKRLKCFKKRPRVEYRSRWLVKRLMKFAWVGGGIGWLVRRLAACLTPPHMNRVSLAYFHPQGYVSTHAQVFHNQVYLGRHAYVADEVVLCEGAEGGAIKIGDNAAIHKLSVLETGHGGKITIGDKSSVHPNVQVKAYMADINIGKGVMIAANCALYSYNHVMLPDKPIREQALDAKGPIIIGDDAWLGTGAIILSGVTIGRGAVIGAGAVVVRDVPDYGIAVGNPAKVIKSRFDLESTDVESVANG